MAEQYLSVDDIQDLIRSTRPDEGRGRFQQIATRLTKYHVMDRLMKEDKQEFQGGSKIQGNLLLNHSFSFSMVGLHEVIEPHVPDLMGAFEVPWRHFTFYSTWERREFLMNKSSSALYKLMDARRVASSISAFEGLEAQFWAESPADLSKDIFPIFYWTPKATAGQTFGLNGKNPTGFNDCAGVDATLSANERWRSNSGIYAEVSEDDSLNLFSKMFRATDFTSPVHHEDYTRGAAKDNRIYMNETTIEAHEKEARSRNDNHGPDLGKFMDMTAFKRLPFEYARKLDAHADDPICWIDWSTMAFVWLEGDYFFEHEPDSPTNQRNSFVAQTDGTCNTWCCDRRCNGVLNRE